MHPQTPEDEAAGKRLKDRMETVETSWAFHQITADGTEDIHTLTSQRLVFWLQPALLYGFYSGISTWNCWMWLFCDYFSPSGCEQLMFTHRSRPMIVSLKRSGSGVTRITRGLFGVGMHIYAYIGYVSSKINQAYGEKSSCLLFCWGYPVVIWQVANGQITVFDWFEKKHDTYVHRPKEYHWLGNQTLQCKISNLQLIPSYNLHSCWEFSSLPYCLIAGGRYPMISYEYPIVSSLMIPLMSPPWLYSHHVPLEHSYNSGLNPYCLMKWRLYSYYYSITIPWNPIKPH